MSKVSRKKTLICQELIKQSVSDSAQKQSKTNLKLWISKVQLLGMNKSP